MSNSETRSQAFGEGYMQSYGEIPDHPVTDPYLADKKLGGHRRQFSPGDPAEVEWFLKNRDALETAYSPERVAKFLKNAFGID